MKQVSNAIFQLKDAGKIERVEGEGRARYKLADGVAAPAPAGKTGRSKAVQADDAARGTPLTGARPAPEPALPKIDIPTQGDAVSPVRPEPVEGLPGIDRLASEAAAALEGNTFEEKAKAARLADAIIARLKHQLTPTFCELEAAAGMDRLSVNIHIEQVDIHLGGL